MTPHLHATLLKQFIEGTLDDDALVQAALHLDSCPACAAACARMDPLTRELGLLVDPSPPAGIAASVVATVQAPQPLGRTDVVVGTALLALAAVLGLVVGDVWHPLLSTGVLIRAAWTGAGHVVGSTLLVAGGVGLSTVVAIGLGIGAARFSRPERVL